VYTDTRPLTARTHKSGPKCRVSPATLESLAALKSRTGISFDALIHRLVRDELALLAEAALVVPTEVAA
jgi:hypothetical protein